ncbi:hypothetical protein [Bacillus thuringiensis]|uniref:hypothetical protein n=1 Tax=Bacillus thuringiensis TaxID=1428 RepID=UPI003338E6E9
MKKAIFMFVMSFLVINSSVNLESTNDYNKINHSHFEAKDLQKSNNLTMRMSDPGGGM